MKTGWDFFQNEVLGMKWLSRLIGSGLNAAGLDTSSRIGGSVQFFIYDTIKIMVLLGVLILVISLHLPRARNSNSIPVMAVVIRIGKIARLICVILVQLELPLAVEKLTH